MQSESRVIAAKAAVLIVIVLAVSSSPAPLSSQHANHSSPKIPKACFFFRPGGFQYASEKDTPVEERAYDQSVDRFYRLWCAPNTSTMQQKSGAADEMVAAWQRLWERDTPYNAAFHESGSLDLLALLGVTHKLPALMTTNPRFTSDWIEGCANACFHLDYDPRSEASGRFTLMQLWLRNDVLDNLKKEPAADPILKMLSEATFTLVD